MRRISKATPLKTGSYLKKGKHFFESTKLLKAQITNLFDFIWPTATAIWNLRWQVHGYISVRDHTLSEAELFAKFGSDNKILRAGISRACIDFTWEEQLEQFANILLINSFAYYESWLEGTLNSIGLLDQQLHKQLQFPSIHSRRGILDAINTITTPESQMLKDAFYTTLKSNPKYSFNNINNLLICYRYFKELRNTIMHGGGIANQALEDASSLYDRLSATDLSAKEKPEYFSFQTGDKVQISIRGVVGFLDIIIKISVTLDAELSRSMYAENEVFSRWCTYVTGNQRLLKSRAGRAEHLKKRFQQCNFPGPLVTSELEAWLSSKGLIV